MNNLLSHKHIDAIHAVIVTGSVTGAATSLNITQPAISNLIKEAEDRLGYLLFERRGGRVIPNNKANLVFNEIERSYTGLNELNQAFRLLKKKDASIFRITSMPAFGSTIVPAAMKKITEKNSNTFFSLNMNRAKNVLSTVNSGKHDIGIAVNNYPLPGLCSEEICTIPLYCYLPKNSKLEGKSEINPEDLMGLNKISMSDIEGIDSIVEKDLIVKGIEIPNLIESPAAISSYSLVAEGLGFMIFDETPALLLGNEKVSVKPYKSDCKMTYRAFWNKSNDQLLLIEEAVAEIKRQARLKIKSLNAI